MSVTLQFNICQSNTCKKFTFTETTKAYDVNNNSTGWGSPNSATTAAETAALTITGPSGITYTFNLFTASYPTTNFNQEFIINNTDLGYASTSTIEDGEWKFVYTVSRTTATAFLYTQTKFKYTTCNAECCVDKMAASIPDTDNCCNNTEVDKVLQAKGFLIGLQYAATCGLKSKYAVLLDTVNKLCGNSNCISC